MVLCRHRPSSTGGGAATPRRRARTGAGVFWPRGVEHGSQATFPASCRLMQPTLMLDSASPSSMAWAGRSTTVCRLCRVLVGIDGTPPQNIPWKAAYAAVRRRALLSAAFCGAPPSSTPVPGFLRLSAITHYVGEVTAGRAARGNRQGTDWHVGGSIFMGEMYGNVGLGHRSSIYATRSVVSGKRIRMCRL